MARQLVVEIVGDSSKFSKTIVTAKDSANGFFSDFRKGIGAGLGIGTFNLASTAISGVTTAITGSLDAASKLQQSTGAVESVFGDATGAIDKFASSAARNLGLSKNQVKEMSAVMGAQLQGMGFKADDAADSTIALTKRAADMAATFGGPTSDAVAAISSLLRGETDPIERYGVSIKQSDINARLAAQGLDGLTGEALKNAQATAAMDLLMQQTAKTEGQFAAESGSLSNQQQIAAAQMENVAASIGEKLLPVATTLATFANETLIPAVMGFIPVLEGVWKEVEPVVQAVAKELVPVFQTVIDIVSRVIAAVWPLVKQALPAIASVIRTLVGIWATAWKTMMSVISAGASFIGSVIDTVIGAVDGVASTVSGVVSSVRRAVDGVIGFFRRAINTFIRAWNGLKFSVPKVDTPFGPVGGFTIGTPNLPYLHAGGIVPGTPGSDVPAILQAGELVVPRKDVGRAGQTIVINLNGPVYGDGIDELARKIAMRVRTAGV